MADVQNAAAIERDDFKVAPRPVPLVALLTEARAYAETLPGDHPVELIVGSEFDGEDRVWTDPDRVGQVLRNLLSNAAKYSPKGAPIELRAQRAQRRVHVEVADYGKGIYPDDQPLIFEKFTRVRGRDGRAVAGAGLGLYLSKRIIRSHGFELTVSSTTGKGSVFGFELEVIR